MVTLGCLGNLCGTPKLGLSNGVIKRQNMKNIKRLYLLSLTVVLFYNLALSLHRVLVTEPTTFEETELSFVASFPSITICPRNGEHDAFRNFSDINDAIEKFRTESKAHIIMGGKGVKK